MQERLLLLIKEEILLLRKWINETNSGYWSTHLNNPMEKRISELEHLYFTISHQV